MKSPGIAMAGDSYCIANSMGAAESQIGTDFFFDFFYVFFLGPSSLSFRLRLDRPPSALKTCQCQSVFFPCVM